MHAKNRGTMSMSKWRRVCTILLYSGIVYKGQVTHEPLIM